MGIQDGKLQQESPASATFDRPDMAAGVEHLLHDPVRSALSVTVGAVGRQHRHSAQVGLLAVLSADITETRTYTVTVTRASP